MPATSSDSVRDSRERISRFTEMVSRMIDKSQEFPRRQNETISASSSSESESVCGPPRGPNRPRSRHPTSLPDHQPTESEALPLLKLTAGDKKKIGDLIMKLAEEKKAAEIALRESEQNKQKLAIVSFQLSNAQHNNDLLKKDISLAEKDHQVLMTRSEVLRIKFDRSLEALRKFKNKLKQQVDIIQSNKPGNSESPSDDMVSEFLEKQGKVDTDQFHLHEIPAQSSVRPPSLRFVNSDDSRQTSIRELAMKSARRLDNVRLSVTELSASDNPTSPVSSSTLPKLEPHVMEILSQDSVDDFRLGNSSSCPEHEEFVSYMRSSFDRFQDVGPRTAPLVALSEDFPTFSTSPCLSPNKSWAPSQQGSRRIGQEVSHMTERQERPRWSVSTKLDRSPNHSSVQSSSSFRRISNPRGILSTVANRFQRSNNFFENEEMLESLELSAALNSSRSYQKSSDDLKMVSSFHKSR